MLLYTASIARTTIGFSVSSNFYSIVQLYSKFLAAAILLLFLLLLIFYISAATKAARRVRLKQSIEQAAKKAVSAELPEEADREMPSKMRLFCRDGLGALSEVLRSMSGDEIVKLRGILGRMKCKEHLVEQFKSDNEEYIEELIHLAGELELVELADEIVRLMLLYGENTNVQYEAFLALVKFGSRDHIVRICMDTYFRQMLSFRSLQEIISAYKGEKIPLFRGLLHSPDPYIERICIKMTASERLISLAPDIEPFLSSDNINHVIDTVRAYGTLKYKPAADKLIALLEHERWEVRSAVVGALAAIDINAYTDQLIKGLQDKEWYVRFNAGQALGSLRDSGVIRKKVAATKDRFAMDMLEYMRQMSVIRRKMA